MNRRIIRLTTHDNNAIFDNSFNQDIQIKPNSKIALLNASAKLTSTTIRIQGNNRAFQYNLGHPTSAPVTTDILLDEATYSSSNYQNLVSDLETKLIQSLNPTITTATGTTGNARMIGLTWQVDVDKDQKTEIAWTQSVRNESTPEQVLVNAVRATANNGVIQRSGGTAGTKDSFVGYKKPLQFGGGIFNSKISNFIDRTGASLLNAGFIFCLINKDPTGLTSIADSDIVIGVQPADRGEKYRLWKNGTQSTSTVDFTAGMVTGSNSTDNGIFHIQYKLGGLTGGFYLGSQYTELVSLTATEVLALSADKIKTKLFPCMIFLGDAIGGATTFGNIAMRNTNTSLLEQVITTESTGALEANRLPAQQRASRQNFIRFGTTELSSYFGYDNIRQPPVGTVNGQTNLIFSAQNDFNGDVLGSENFIFQLLSHDLDCYDGSNGSRKNILMTMPSVKTTDLTLSFQTNTPIYLSFRNHSAFSLRNIRARILDYDNQEIEVAGLSNATLVIED